MFDARRDPQVVSVGASAGEILTVVDSSVRSRLDVALGEVARPVHLDSVSEAIAAVGAGPVRAVLVGLATFSPDPSPSVLRLAAACAGSTLVVVTGGWTPGLPETLLVLAGC
jgi:hypothetical protein